MRMHSYSNRSDSSRSDRGRLIGAAAFGAAVATAGLIGRKFAVQAVSGVQGDWVDVLSAEHKMALAIFDKIEQTPNDAKARRSLLLTQLKHAIGKHAFQEENIVYPALRKHNGSDDASHLEHEHAEIKTYFYELTEMPNDSPQWLEKVREFHQLVESHAREEEDEVFPPLRSSLSEEENRKLTMQMNKEGLKLA